MNHVGPITTNGYHLDLDYPNNTLTKMHASWHLPNEERFADHMQQIALNDKYLYDNDMLFTDNLQRENKVKLAKQMIHPSAMIVCHL